MKSILPLTKCRRALRLTALVCCALSLLGACGASDEASTADAAAAPIDVNSGGDSDVTSGEEVVETDTAGSGCEFLPSLKQATQALRAAPEDCDSGFCVDTAEGKRHQDLLRVLPDRLALRASSGPRHRVRLPAEAHVAVLALRRRRGLWRAGVWALCLPYKDAETGALSHFCGGACETDADCPSGYACELSKGTDGASKQCVKQRSLCACSPKAVASGAKGLCSRSNDVGVCEGVQVCGADGLGACDALVPAAETCDGVDNDCDGQTDEELSGEPCEVNNGAGSCKGVNTCKDGASVCDAPEPQQERCDGADNDCDGVTDEGCDDDGDGYCALGIEIAGLPAVCTQDKAACNGSAGLPTWCPKGIGDCLDSGASAAEVHPGMPETCGNQLDDDCDGQTDATAEGANPKGCTLHYVDADGDGFGGLKGACLCGPSKAYPVTDNSDCKDDNKLVNPKAKEICGNKQDDNCDNKQNRSTRSTASTSTRTKTATARAPATASACASLGRPSRPRALGTVTTRPKRSTRQRESCNGVDDNCDGATDEANAEGCKTWYADGDGDTFGDVNKSACLCGPSKPFTTLQGGDCNDASYAINPNFKEICFNGVDDDCDSSTDEEGGKGCTDYYKDADGDGYGGGSKKCLCEKNDVKGYNTTKTGDCDDSKAGVGTYPGAQEICDGKDNNCDGKTDEGCNGDGDGYCAKGKIVVGKPKVCPKGGGDCDDTDTTTFPGAMEFCDGKDNNCKGGVDEGCDDDGDGWCDAKMIVVGKPAVCSSGLNDCADGNPQINPAAKEICDNKDNNCSGVVDEGCDDDGDGWCDKNMIVVGKPKVCPKGGGDCCDTDNSAKPQVSAWFDKANKCGPGTTTARARRRSAGPSRPTPATSAQGSRASATPARDGRRRAGLRRRRQLGLCSPGTDPSPSPSSTPAREYKPRTRSATDSPKGRHLRRIGPWVDFRPPVGFLIGAHKGWEASDDGSSRHLARSRLTPQ